jgi:hypothetical protein
MAEKLLIVNKRDLATRVPCVYARHAIRLAELFLDNHPGADSTTTQCASCGVVSFGVSRGSDVIITGAEKCTSIEWLQK